ncbi:hypothetical protein [Acinetobacter indicus]|uniref:hypothetical protein n=1 Tax=Acinetobacter indicus TaxID=756892 RepID=UPI00148BB75C|nr:hypothetical protein [Acinetobacter indicus]NOJ66699.1 hypothetical protein [Acinetobacter indicus]
MIKDIPTSDEFDLAAKAQFDFAWDIAMSFLVTIEDVSSYISVEEEEVRNFWESARQRILTSLIIAQQGIELALKAKLVAVSPYLLIAGSPSEWPKDNDGIGVSFSDFRAIDAQDLIKVYNTVYEEKLSPEFIELFERVRKLRNKAMHTVSRDLNVTAQEVIFILLEVHESLYTNENWIETRREFLHSSPATQLYYNNDHVEGLVVKEFLIVFNFLKPAQKQRFFKINPKQRLYFCPVCKHEGEKYESLEPRYAILSPNEPNSETIFCFVCNETHLVCREDCPHSECPGNVLSVEYGICCTCGEDYI